MEQVTYTDWDKECELLKEWLVCDIQNYSTNIIHIDQYVRDFKKGIVWTNEPNGLPRLTFDQWKAYQLWENDMLTFMNRYIVPTYMDLITEQEFKSMEGFTIIQPIRVRTINAREPWPFPWSIPTNIIFKH